MPHAPRDSRRNEDRWIDRESGGPAAIGRWPTARGGTGRLGASRSTWLASGTRALALWLGAGGLVSAQPGPPNFVRGEFRELNDNGAWSWFMDPRVIVDHGRLLVGSVRANGAFRDSTRPGWGDVELTVFDLGRQTVRHVKLHEHLEQDDHDAPGLLVLEDGRYLAAYSRHNQEPRMYWRVSTAPGDPLHWGPESELVTPGVRGNWSGDNFTYANPMRMSKEPGRLYLFHRGVSQDPNYLVSDDDARSWRYGGKLFDGLHGYSPYAKYACNGQDTIHVVATEDHPRNHNNSLYHAFIRGGLVYGSDGHRIGPLSTGTNTTLRPWDFTRIYQGGPGHVAWMTDIRLDPRQRPVVLFTVKRGDVGLRQGSGGQDHRFHYARWDGSRWHAFEIAFAGERLYRGEEDYTGLGAIDPQDPRVIYISTDREPRTGEPLISRADGQCHHEIFRGRTRDGGQTWDWLPITANSTTENLRPIMPVWKDRRALLLWMRGGYWNNRGEWTTKVVATMLDRRALRH
ncbi:MAG: BNR-4 repeat-containing protein [Verrucomicrobia bacterium]|nr:BNR-4 repeat-containing protein [Verrucomicrobiota bacterium]